MKKTKQDRYTRRCEAITDQGEQCKAMAKRDSDPPRCAFHSLTKEEQLELARKGGLRRQQKRREAAEPKVRTNLSPTVSLEDVLRACAPALEATFEHNGHPDWGARLAAAGTLLMCFPRHLRDTPEKVSSLLERCLPERVHLTAQQLAEGAVYRAMRAEWDALRVRWHPLTGLYVEPYPGYMIAPWEERAAVLASQPKPQGDVDVNDGRVYLRRPGELPMLLEQDG